MTDRRAPAIDQAIDPLIDQVGDQAVNPAGNRVGHRAVNPAGDPTEGDALPHPRVGLLGPTAGSEGPSAGRTLSVAVGAAGPGSALAPVDGIAVLFFESAGPAHLVFVSQGLGAMTGRGPAELLGRTIDLLFGAVAGRAEADAVRRALVGEHRPEADADGSSAEGFGPGKLFDRGSAAALDLTIEPARIEVGERGDAGPGPAGSGDRPRHPSRNPRRANHHSTRLLRSAGGSERPVHITYTALPSLGPSAGTVVGPGAGPSFVLAEFRDLGRDTAERLLADQAAVVGSLSRGHELGRLCHQVCMLIEGALDDGSRCMMGLVGPEGELEPVVIGGLPVETVTSLMRTIARSSVTPMKRIVSVEGLPVDQARAFGSTAARSGGDAPDRRVGPDATAGAGPGGAIWYHPVVAAGGKLVAAFLIATDRHRPDEALTRTVDHLATVMSTAIEHSSTEADYAHQALHDPLTRLPNRALLVDRLEQAIAWSERDGIALSVLLVDIDRFRSVNDTRGPEVGDRVLLEVAGRLLAAVRLGDTVGRVGNDQFLIMCLAANGELDAAAVARRILRALSEPMRLDDPSGETAGPGADPSGEIRITASIGVAEVDEPGASAVTVIGNAESALRQAGDAGRGQYAIFEAELRQDALIRHETEQALHRAITDNELVVHYQPLVEVRSGYVVGAEALVRWARPGHDLLYPGSFIPIAVESELIVPLGGWLIDQVCADLADWPDRRGRSPLIMVNLSAQELAVDTLVPTVVSALQRNGLHPARLGFEITESMEIEDLDAASRNLNRLSKMGCRIAIDDFGIGHATLHYLRQFSMADAFKIDRSFVAGLGNSREDTAIVHALMALAAALEMQVIAEGVEDLDQLTGLEALGCRYAQGYALGRPAPLQQMRQWWAEGRAFLPEHALEAAEGHEAV